jgi:hypothetical protein
MKRAIFVLLGVTICGCGSSGEKKAQADAGAPASSAAPVRARLTSKDSSRIEQPTLADDQVRVSLFVVPGDALVEVDGAVVRRRHGTIELVGKVGDEHRVRVVSGTTRTNEQVVKIDVQGTLPPMIDARGVAAPR